MPQHHPLMLADDFPNQRFLLVDDSPEHLELLQRYLSSLGLSFATARDGRQATDLLHSQRFDIVISDILMPKVDGMELLRLVKERYPETDVILMTGYSKTYTFTDVIDAGATDYLEKPFSRDAVRAKILRILRERKLGAELKAEIRHREEMGRMLEKKSIALTRRGSALNCLYRISTLLEDEGQGLPALLGGAVAIIPSAFDGALGARLVHGQEVYDTPDFVPSPETLAAVIRSQGNEVGRLEVAMPTAGKAAPPAADEDRALLDEVAERIGYCIERQQAAEALHHYFATLEERVRQGTKDYQAAQAALEAVFQSLPDAVVSVDAAMVVTHGNEPGRRLLNIEVGRPFPATGDSFRVECAKALDSTLRTHEAVVDYRLEIRGADEISIRQVVLVSTSPVRDSSGGYAGAVLLVHDITRLANLEEQLSERRKFRTMVGKSQQMQELYEIVRKVAEVDTTILITGESGTGKELLVETLHASGNRADRPLIRVNCAALPENLLESELFGHVRGAFTGATKDRVGRIQAAEGGILFLDEIGDISPRIQLQLLRFLEVREYERVGESQPRKADVRIFAATNANLTAKVREGLFREDLYYRLKVMVIHIPALRERLDDIPFLVEHFLAFFGRKFNKSFAGLSPEALDIFMNHDWPGNVRELKHVVEHACLLSPGRELRLEHLPKDLVMAKAKMPLARQPARALTREALIAALRRTGGNKAKAARLLHLSRATLYSKIKEFLIDEDGAVE